MDKVNISDYECNLHEHIHTLSLTFTIKKVFYNCGVFAFYLDFSSLSVSSDIVATAFRTYQDNMVTS